MGTSGNKHSKIHETDIRIYITNDIKVLFIIVIDKAIKAYGKYDVEIKVHPEVTAKFIVHVHD